MSASNLEMVLGGKEQKAGQQPSEEEEETKIQHFHIRHHHVPSYLGHLVKLVGSHPGNGRAVCSSSIGIAPHDEGGGPVEHFVTQQGRLGPGRSRKALSIEEMSVSWWSLRNYQPTCQRALSF